MILLPPFKVFPMGCWVLTQVVKSSVPTSTRDDDLVMLTAPPTVVPHKTAEKVSPDPPVAVPAPAESTLRTIEVLAIKNAPPACTDTSRNTVAPLRTQKFSPLAVEGTRTLLYVPVPWLAKPPWQVRLASACAVPATNTAPASATTPATAAAT